MFLLIFVQHYKKIMTMLEMVDPVLKKFQDHLKELEVDSKIESKNLDFESGYVDTFLLGTKDGIGNAGSLKMIDSPIDFVNIIKKQEFAKCDFAVGGFAGMGVHLHSWWKLRFFLSFPEFIQIGPFDMGTLTTIKKKLFHSEVEDFIWSGYAKLTTLPPGLIRDDVSAVLDSDQILKNLMMKCLLKERTIYVSRYSPKKQSSFYVNTNSKIVIESTWKLQKDLFFDADTIAMYEKIAEDVKSAVYTLRYHLK